MEDSSINYIALNGASINAQKAFDAAFSDNYIHVPEDQKAAWLAKAYPHQKVWFESRDQPYRNILVERQCGITTAMAVEAYIQAKESGCLQVMIAPTVSQAEIFRQYILQYLVVNDL